MRRIVSIQIEARKLWFKNIDFIHAANTVFTCLTLINRKHEFSLQACSEILSLIWRPFSEFLDLNHLQNLEIFISAHESGSIIH